MTVAVDWDDTLANAKTQEWLPDAQESLMGLLMQGHKVIVHSCRVNWPEGLQELTAKLPAHPNLTIHVAAGKPRADLYVDDRAVVFQGDWAETLGEIRRRGSMDAIAS